MRYTVRRIVTAVVVAGALAGGVAATAAIDTLVLSSHADGHAAKGLGNSK